MRILYFSVHEVLEYDELRILTELGHECFSLGQYRRPHHGSLLRPPIHGLPYDPHFADIVDRFPKYNLPSEIFEDKDIIIVMHDYLFIINNWEKIKHKRVIWRTIGQSVSWVENMLLPYREQGLEIVRYSPRERLIPNYIGEDAVIRFYKDPKEYGKWIGNKSNIMALNQSMNQRAECNYDLFHQVCKGLPVKLFGPNNDGVPECAGLITYEQVKQEMRKNRVFFYTGTHITSYTLGFIEAFMTGIPIVSIGNIYGNSPVFQQQTFEIPEIIENGRDGFVSDNVSDLRAYLKELLNNYECAKMVSENARKKAIKLFGKENIKKQWNEYLNIR